MHFAKSWWFSSAHGFRLQWYGSDMMYKSQKVCLMSTDSGSTVKRWLRREIIVHHIHGVVESFGRKRKQKEGTKVATHEEKREEFRRLLLDAAKPFVLQQAERFVSEVELFLASGLNIEAYDKVYMQHLAGMSTAAK
ncbi:tripartite motif-containing protein 40-like [Iris pallida]|uniref:Tripartite motif-containing protein 40-like n=2 Tax=Iris pallida TaxID=29817 RepID=A0AAX6FGI8_IRIPA|nr:tripartite motif-containing protein 40-like [Iris pallida]KAJ6815507.1 tripartite motif-containing protein 40-like [Iris pallida]